MSRISEHEPDPIAYVMVSLCLIVVLVVLFVGYRSFEDSIRGDDTLKLVFHDAGHIKRVDSCYSGKYSYRCNIATDKWEFGFRDIDDIKGGPVSVGEKVELVEKLTPQYYWKKFCIRNVCPWGYERFDWRSDEYKKKYRELMGVDSK